MAKFRQTGYVQLRRGIAEHLQNGSISKGEFLIYMLILINANPATGVWHGTAGVLGGFYGFSDRTCRDDMEKLEQKGYIRRFQSPGKRSDYPILINNYECTVGAALEMRLNAIDSIDYDHLFFNRCRVGAGESAAVIAAVYAGKYLENLENIEKTTKALRGGKAARATKGRKRGPEGPTLPAPAAASAKDIRHAVFRDALARYWRHTNANSNVPEMPWDVVEGKALADLLSASPNLDAGAFLKLLNNRRLSDTNQTERPYVWLRKVTDYAGGPLDRFGKPKGAGNATSGNNRAQARTDSQRSAAQAALDRIRMADGNADVASFGT